MKGMFDEAILARMITDNRDGSARCQRVPQERKRFFEAGELSVHGNSKRLEEPGEIVGTGPRPEDGANGVHEIVAGGKRSPFTPPDNLAGQPVGAGLVPPLLEPGAEGLDRCGVEEIGTGRAVRSHAHVERGPGAEGKAARLLIELPRRDPQIHQDEIGAEIVDLRQRLGAPEWGFEIPNTRLAEPFPGNSDRVGIPVDGKQLRPRLKERFSVAAVAQRRVDDPAGALGGVQHLGQENWLVKCHDQP